MKLVLCLLTFALLVAMPPAFSQSNLYVDTKERCSKIKGTWATSTFDLRGQGVTMESCYVDMNPYGECRQAGGHSIVGAPDEIRCQLPQSELGKMAQCREKLGFWGTTSWGFVCYLQADEQKCRLEGGDWKIGGMLNGFRCVKIAADGGKPCTSSKQCQFGCLAFGPPMSVNDEVVGACAYDNIRSCWSFVENGRYGPRACE